jgi:hypothetical protein
VNSGTASRHPRRNSMLTSEAMSSAQRLDTVADILAGALLRLRAKHAAERKEREFFRDSHLEVRSEIDPYAIGPK